MLGTDRCGWRHVCIYGDGFGFEIELGRVILEGVETTDMHIMSMMLRSSPRWSMLRCTKKKKKA